MIVCPGCGQEVHLSEPHVELMIHGSTNPLIRFVSWYGGRAQAPRFHNEQCLKKWLDLKLTVPAK
jgi:hypothetical protein